MIFYIFTLTGKLILDIITFNLLNAYQSRNRLDSLNKDYKKHYFMRKPSLKCC